MSSKLASVGNEPTPIGNNRVCPVLTFWFTSMLNRNLSPIVRSVGNIDLNLADWSFFRCALWPDRGSSACSGRGLELAATTNRDAQSGTIAAEPEIDLRTHRQRSTGRSGLVDCLLHWTQRSLRWLFSDRVALSSSPLSFSDAELIKPLTESTLRLLKAYENKIISVEIDHLLQEVCRSRNVDSGLHRWNLF